MQRITHNLIQSSPEWHTFRAQHFGASEASAMLGMSPYKTRDQLLHEKATGLTQEIDANTQKVFDRGHEAERLARPIAEKLTSVELSPVVMSFGKLSASTDGLDFEGIIAWENKQFNKAHFEQVKRGELPEIHWPQCQQGLHVTGAEKLFFTISDGTEENTVGVWVYPDQDKVKTILAGWAQFEIDLANYVPPVQVEKVVAETVEALPVPSVVVRGEITSSNLSEITPKFDAYLANIKTELITDQDFADAEANGKNCEDAEKRIQALRENIIAQMVSVNEVDSALSNYQEAFRKMKVLLKNAVKEQKETIKTNAILKAKQEYSNFVSSLDKELPLSLVTKLIPPNFAEAIKNVKSIASMQSRLNDAVANGKAEATTLANDVKTKLAYIDEAGKGYEHLINKWELAFKELDYIKLNIQSIKDAEDKRKAEHEARIKAQAEADARAKIEAEQRAKEAEQRAKQVNEAKPQVSESEAVTLSSQHQVDEPQSSLTLSNVKNQIADMFAEPSADDIITVIANHYVVSHDVAKNWLYKHFYAKAA